MEFSLVKTAGISTVKFNYLGDVVVHVKLTLSPSAVLYERHMLHRCTSQLSKVTRRGHASYRFVAASFGYEADFGR